MREVFVIADNVVSPLGNTTKENFAALCNNLSGVNEHDDTAKSEKPFFASVFDKDAFKEDDQLTKFEQLLIRSISDSLSQINIDVKSERVGLIISSTKGNISLIESNELTAELKERVSLSSSAKKVAEHFSFASNPVIVSHACISGLVAMITAKRLLQADKFDTIVVAGADTISKFILSGFQSFQAVSDELCKPFDANRKGINLGEAAATIILSINKPDGEAITLSGGAVSNDANHISGPSRTGEELFQAIDAALKESGIDKSEIDFISAHGTATMYNDDMESKAITLAGLQNIPLNSLKGFYGHTLGAAGLLEVAISIQSLKQGKIIPTKGCDTPGTAMPVNVCTSLIEKEAQAFLKTASGFGGCNAAVILEKVNGE